MDIKCNYCGNLISKSTKKCPLCGADNYFYNHFKGKNPKTIEDLISYCVSRDIDYNSFGIAIGEIKYESGVKGVAKRGNKIMIYENDNEYSFDILYEGDDEAYAVGVILRDIKNKEPEKHGLATTVNCMTREEFELKQEQDKKDREDSNLIVIFLLFIVVVFGILLVSIIT